MRNYLFLFLLLFIASVGALGTYNASATQVIYIYANNTDTNPHIQAAGIVNLTQYAANFSASCDNFQLTLNISGQEVPTVVNITGTNNISTWVACKPEIYAKFAYNITGNTNNQLVAIGYITPSTVLNPPFKLKFDHFNDNSNNWTCYGYAFTDITQNKTASIPADESSYCYMNLTENTGAISIKQHIDASTGASIVIAARGWTDPLNLTYPTYMDGTYFCINRTNVDRQFIAVNGSWTDNFSSGASVVGVWANWRMSFSGSVNKIFSEYNTSASDAKTTAGNNAAPYSMVMISGLDGGPVGGGSSGVNSLVDELVYWDAPTLTPENFYVYGYNNSNTVWSVGTAGLGGFTVTQSAPTNTTYLNGSVLSNFTVSGPASTYKCWQTLDGTTTSLGTINNNTPYASVLGPLAIGGHTINITCQNTTTNISAITKFAEINYASFANSTTDTINETETAIFNSSIKFNTIISSTSAILWHNTTTYTATLLGVDNYTASFGRTVETPLILSNNTNITYNWQFTFTYANGTNETVNMTLYNQSVYFAYFFSNFTLNETQLLEGNNIGANVSIIAPIQKATINVSISMHTSQYAAPNSTLYYFFTNAQPIPTLTVNPQTFGVFANITYSYGGFTRNYTTTNLTITATQFNLTNCTAGAIALTYYLKDEITYDLINGTWEKTFTYSSGSVTKNYSNKWVNLSRVDICLIPTWATFKVNSVEQHYHTNNTISYQPRAYFLVNATVSNTTTTINEYLLNSTFAKLVQITVLGTTNQPIAGAVVMALRYRIANNSLEVVAMGRTGADGITSIYLQPIDTFYKFIIVDNLGNILLSTDATQTIPCDPAVALCQKGFIVNPENIAEFWDYQGSLAHSCAFNNATGWYSCDYTDTSGLARKCTLLTYRMGAFGLVSNCTNSLTTSAGTLACYLGNITGTRFIARLYCDYASTSYIIHEEILDQAGSASFGNYGQFLAILIVIFLPLIGLFNPAIAVLLGFVGLAGAMVMGLYDIGLGALVGLGVAVLVIMYKLKT